jgi:hypothetical protein
MTDPEHDIEAFQHASGKWLASCPVCDRVLEAQTTDGAVQVVLEHLNARHPCTNPLCEATWVGNSRTRGEC